MQELSLTVAGFGMFDSRVKFPNGIRTEPRLVTEYEIELCVEDQPGTGFIEDNEVPLRKNTLICAKPGQQRCSILPFRCLYLHLQTQDPALLELLNSLPDSCVLAEGDVAKTRFLRLLQLDVDSDPSQWFLAHAWVLELLYNIHQSTASGRERLPTAHRRAMEQIRRYILEDLSRELSLEQLAETVSFSPSYFHKVFRLCFGMTPAVFVQNCRLSAAKTMLAAAELPLERIAEACGFGSQSYFNYRFRQATGQTPLQYRREQLSRMKI